MSTSTLQLTLSRSKTKLMQASVAGCLGFGTLTMALPAQALDFTATGDVTGLGDPVVELTNAFSNGSDDSTNFNLSGSDPVGIDELEGALGVQLGALDDNPTEGSAIITELLANAGDIFSFDWEFFTNDNLSADYAFVTVLFEANPLAEVFKLATAPTAASGKFSYSFANAGNYKIGIGIVDVGDATGSSGLTISNANVEAIPTPALLPGLIGLGLGVVRKRKSEAAKA